VWREAFSPALLVLVLVIVLVAVLVLGGSKTAT